MSTAAHERVGSLVPLSIRPGRPIVRSTFQMAADVACSGNEEEAYRRLRDLAVRWLARKYPDPLPKHATHGASFICEIPGQKLEVVCIAEQNLWTARLEQPDAPFLERPAVAGRTWTTDISLKIRGTLVAAGVRVQCASLAGCDAPIVPTTPRIVREWAQAVDLRSLMRVTATPWRLQSQQDLEALRGQVRAADRELPIVVLTQPDRKHRTHMREWVLDEVDLARRLLGLAHVVLLSNDLSFAWTKMIGKPWSAYNGAVRVYLPGLDLELDSPFNHPLATVDAILAYRTGDLLSEKAFTESLVRRMFEASATRRVRWNDRLFVPEARGLAAELDRQRLTQALLARQETSGQVELLRQQVARINEAYEAQLASLRQQIAAAEQEAEQYCDLASQADRDRDWYRQENGNLRWQISSLRSALATRPGPALDDGIPLPASYDDVPDWVGRQLAGRVILHPRAVNAVKDAIYDDVELVCRCLLLLANDYRDMRLSVEGAKARFDIAANELGVRLDPSITKARAGEQGDTYFVTWPVGSAQKAFLESHLRKGSTKDDRVCLAIYFFWDESTSQVVVGWLPSHLRNRMS